MLNSPTHTNPTAQQIHLAGPPFGIFKFGRSVFRSYTDLPHLRHIIYHVYHVYHISEHLVSTKQQSTIMKKSYPKKHPNPNQKTPKKSKRKHTKTQPIHHCFTATIHLPSQTSLSRSPCTLELTTRSEPAKSTKDNKPWQRPWPPASVDGWNPSIPPTLGPTKKTMEKMKVLSFKPSKYGL